MDGNQVGVSYGRDADYWKKTLDKALPDFHCRACGHKDWDVQHEPKHDGVLHWLSMGHSGYRTLLTIPVVCSNCGLTEIFSPEELEALAARVDG